MPQFAYVTLEEPKTSTVRFTDDEGRPHAHCRYELAVGGRTLSGRTNERGVLQVALAEGTSEGQLSLWLAGDQGEATEVLRVRFVEPPPIDTVAGVQVRLANLGYGGGATDGTLDERTRAAIRDFETEELAVEKPSGEITPALRNALLSLHGG